VEYLICCYYISTFDTLWLLAGTQGGIVGYFPLHIPPQSTRTSNVGVVGPASAVLEGGHTGVVRSVWSPYDVGTNVGTGLEGLMLGPLWKALYWDLFGRPFLLDDLRSKKSTAWVASGLVCHKQRHAPY
jgi:hypothetical protein